MKSVTGVVLCGGLGSRLRPLTYYFQKVMLPIGTAQRPILEYILRSMKNAGIERTVLLANYKVEQIKNYFDDGEELGMKLSYIVDDPKMQGSGGALLNAWKKVEFESPTLLVYYGDILTTLKLEKLLQQHHSHSSIATLAVATEFKVPVGVAKMKEDKIYAFEEKPRIKLNVGLGIMAIQTSALSVLDEIYMEKKSIDIMGDLLPELIKRGEKVEGFPFEEFWLDVGSIEAYEKIDPKKFDEMFGYLVKPRLNAK